MSGTRGCYQRKLKVLTRGSIIYRRVNATDTAVMPIVIATDTEPLLLVITTSNTSVVVTVGYSFSGSSYVLPFTTTR
jgi:CMP-2-keto-3-deoxyoctulosonic acid synthetase